MKTFHKVATLAFSLLAPVASAHAGAKSVQTRTLSFADRVAYQYAIEEVYWRHRIWPKDNPGAKPALDKVMSRAQIERKVEEYLRKSQALETRGETISHQQLQAEMERIARDTKQPNVLNDLFQALHNDAFLIAECLARPILAERTIAHFRAGHDETASGANLGENNTQYNLPAVSIPAGCDDVWTAPTTVNAPAGRWWDVVVWTGTEMIVWGGEVQTPPYYSNTGGRYMPATDSWAATSTTNAPAARWLHVGVWSGTDMIIWGGTNGVSLNTGGKYNPTADTWTDTTTVGAPVGRYALAAVWTGNEMIVWGGGEESSYFNTGGRYDPNMDMWASTTTTNAPAGRQEFTSIWTGSEMIVWGGYGTGGVGLNTGGRYNPTANVWAAINMTNSPSARGRHSAVWTNSEMIIWGGGEFLNSGGRYSPAMDSWIATSLTNAPDARQLHTGVWTGSEMIVWGGWTNPPAYFNTGGRYDPVTDGWVSTTIANAPSARYGHTAIWTGDAMIIWGGNDGDFLVNSGGRYCAQPELPVVQSAVSRKTHGAAGGFDVNLPLNGIAGIECRTGGTTNDHIMVISFSANVTVDGNPQAGVTLGEGTIGSDGTPNGGMVFVSGNVVTVPLTNVTNAQTINVTLYSVNGVSNFVIPMSVLTGDVNGNGVVNASDASLTKSRLGQTVNGTNFRSDVNAGGAINASDVSLVKSYLGTGLP